MRPQTERKSQIQWRDSCPFHPNVDMWGRHERSKTREPSDKSQKVPGWSCSYSNKTFKNEHYIDLHLERHYMNETPAVGGICLEDYCEVFEVCKMPEPESMLDSWSSEPPSCDSAQLSVWQQTCYDVVDRCLPIQETEMKESTIDQLKKKMCEPLTCEARSERHFTDRRHMIIWVVCGVIFVLLIIVCQMYSDTGSPKYKRPPRYSSAGKKFN